MVLEKIEEITKEFELTDNSVVINKAYLVRTFFKNKRSFIKIRKSSQRIYIKIQNYFDSSGCSPPQKLSKVIIKRKECCSYSEHQIQKTIVFVRVIFYK